MKVHKDYLFFSLLALAFEHLHISGSVMSTFWTSAVKDANDLERLLESVSAVRLALISISFLISFLT